MADPVISYVLDTTNITAWVTKINRIPITDRNSNFEPILTSLKIEVKQDISFVPAIDDVLTIEIDSDPQYQGKVKKVVPNSLTMTYLIDIEHGLFELTRRKIDFPTLDKYIFSVGVADFTFNKTVTGVGGTTFVTIPTHGLSNDDIVAFKESGDTDDQLLGERYFYATVSDANNISLQTEPGTPYVGDPLGIFPDLTGSKVTYVVDLNKYNHYDNDNGSNLGMHQLFDSFANLIGVTFDYTDIATWTVYTALGVGLSTFTWDEICLDKDMLYCFGQSVAVDHDVIDNQGNEGSRDTDYRDRRMNCFELFSYMMSVFGFSLHYKTADTWEILKPSNTLYSFTPKEKYSNKEYTKVGEENSTFGDESFALTTGTRPAYKSPSANDLEDGSKFNSTLLGKTNNINNVNYISNLLLFLRDSSAGLVVTPTDTSKYFDIEDATAYRQDSIQDDWTVQEVSSPIKTGVYTIKQHFVTVDLTKGKRSNIIQES